MLLAPTARGAWNSPRPGVLQSEPLQVWPSELGRQLHDTRPFTSAHLREAVAE